VVAGSFLTFSAAGRSATIRRTLSGLSDTMTVCTTTTTTVGSLIHYDILLLILGATTTTMITTTSGTITTTTTTTVRTPYTMILCTINSRKNDCRFCGTISHF